MMTDFLQIMAVVGILYCYDALFGLAYPTIKKFLDYIKKLLRHDRN